MQKFCALIIFSLMACVFLSACNIQPDNSMIKSKRRFEQYIKPQHTGGMVDLFEGPKQNYDAYLGPQKLDFDFKIVNPY